jgi:hypothetical protein
MHFSNDSKGRGLVATTPILSPFGIRKGNSYIRLQLVS